jgi:hypothetical protein
MSEVRFRGCEEGDVFLLLFLRFGSGCFLSVDAFGRLWGRRLRGFFVLNRAFGRSQAGIISLDFFRP